MNKILYLLLCTLYMSGCAATNKAPAAIDTKSHESSTPAVQTGQGTGNYQETPAYMFVAPRSANVRLEPSLDAKVIAQLPIGAKVKIIQQNGVWFQVEYQAVKTGWCHKNALAVDQK